MVRTGPPDTKVPATEGAHSTQHHHKNNLTAVGFFINISSAEAASSAASDNKVVDMGPNNTVDIKTYVPCFVRGARVCVRCATTLRPLTWRHGLKSCHIKKIQYHQCNFSFCPHISYTHQKKRGVVAHFMVIF